MIVRICFFLLLFMQSLLVSANFEKATALYQKGRFEQAREAFETLAAIGDRSSLFNIGVMTYRGEAFAQDTKRALALMTLANEGLNDPGFKGVIERISSQLNEQELQQVNQLIQTLKPDFGIREVMENVLPVPLDDEDCAPVHRAKIIKQPKYPTVNARRGVMGVVFTSYTISPEGYARDVVATVQGNRSFAREVAVALRKFRYDPPVDGLPVYGHRNHFSFNFGKKTTVHKEKVSKEIEELKSGAEAGDHHSQYLYARRLNVLRYFKEYMEGIDVQYRTANEWYQKSAQQGLANAQYEIGLNMLVGRGCEVDRENGMKWIAAAAISGYSPAQRTLAQSALKAQSKDDRKLDAAISWLRNAVQNDDYAARVLLAWELASTDNKKFQNAEEALDLLKEKAERYYDPVRIEETRAAAYAVLGDFEKALKHQKKAKKLADKNEWEIPLLNERLKMYEKGQPYYGGYYEL